MRSTRDAERPLRGRFPRGRKGRSNQLVIFLDSTGRAYTCRRTACRRAGQGEPLTGRVSTRPTGPVSSL